MLKKLLIANRGEIAVRIARSAKRLGVRTVAVYSDADRDAMHVKCCDEAQYIGQASPQKSYLSIEKIISAALSSQADAIHPGYGFLSENDTFARSCLGEGIVFVGPSPEAIEIMGSKIRAKQMAEKIGVSLLPGYHGERQDSKYLADRAEEIGYPIMIKAASGGGGKGMRVVHDSVNFDQSLEGARREAKSSFNNDEVLLEKFLIEPRHIEVQIFGDTYGNYVHLFERDCSIQRRHQKVIEEAPAPFLSNEQRAKLTEEALCLAKEIEYVGAGTVEFVMDRSGKFYFLEMNTRLQVEHPVTEMIAHQDLVEWQLKIASGEELPVKQNDIHMRGHAIEARVYAEDPAKGFVPSAGQVAHLKWPEESENLRVDTGVSIGDVVGVDYDPMIAKFISWDQNREKAVDRLNMAISNFEIAGFSTNKVFLKKLMSYKKFAKLTKKNMFLDTGFIDKNKKDFFVSSEPTLSRAAILALLAIIEDKKFGFLSNPVNSEENNVPWNSLRGWALDGENIVSVALKIHEEALKVTADFQRNKIVVEVFGTSFLLFEYTVSEGRVEVCAPGGNFGGIVLLHKEVITVFLEGEDYRFEKNLGDINSKGNESGGMRSPLPGTLVSVSVREGSVVKKGDILMVVEAMKMEHMIVAEYDGTIQKIYFKKDDRVGEGDQLLEIEEVK